MVQYGQFEVLAFDCDGALIDRETGIAVRAQLGETIVLRSDDQLLAAFVAVEHDAEVPYKSYREVLALSQFARYVAARVDDALSEGER